jgi:hypothetical protein
MKIKRVLSMVPMLIAGCVSVPPATRLSNDSASAWQGKTLAVTTRARESFVAMTAGKAAFALIGAAAMIEAGNKIVKENDIEDPAPHLAADLADAAVGKYSVVRYTGPAIAVSSDDIQKLARAASGADLLLDVQSLGSSFRYLPVDWSHYIVDSRYIVRLIDVKSAKVVGAGTCSGTSKDETPLPTKDELLDNRAQRLKSILAAQRDHCLTQFKATVLNISG